MSLSVVEALLFLLLGFVISIVASQVVRTRHNAAQLDGSTLHQTQQEADARVNEIESIFEAMTDSIFVFDNTGQILRMNAAARELFVLDDQQEHYSQLMQEQRYNLAPHDDSGQLLPEEQWPLYRILHGETLTSANSMDVTVRTPVGQDLQLNVSGAPLCNKEGKLTGAVCICRDVTERRQLERRTQETLNALLAMAETLVLPFDPAETQSSRASGVAGSPSKELPFDPAETQSSRLPASHLSEARSASFVGEMDSRSASGVAGSPSQELVPDSSISTGQLGPTTAEEAAPRDIHKVAQRLVELTRSVLGCERVAITTIEPDSGEMHAVAASGLSPEEEHQWQTRTPGFHLSELLAGTTEESQLRANEAVILDMTDPQFSDKPNPYNIAAMLIVPMSVGDQLVGMLSLDYGSSTPFAVPGVGSRAVNDANASSLQDTSSTELALLPFGSDEVQGVRSPQGERKEKEQTYSADKIALAKAVAKLAALVIERERLLLERAEAQANELALREANRRMDEFLGMTSHELKTPLTSIKGNTQLTVRQLRNSVQNIQKMQGMLESTERQVKLLDRLVDDLLDFSRTQANQLELSLAPCDLATIVSEAVEEQRRVWPARTINLYLPPTTMRAGSSYSPHQRPAMQGYAIASDEMQGSSYSPHQRQAMPGYAIASDEMQGSSYSPHQRQASESHYDPLGYPLIPTDNAGGLQSTTPHSATPHRGLVEGVPPASSAQSVGEAASQDGVVASSSAGPAHKENDPLLPVYGDSERLSQVVTNYLTNALKYSYDDRAIQVRLESENGQARVSVQDEGAGLSPEEQTRIWDRFYRAEGVEVLSRSQTSMQGLGLGLHICKAIIEQHHGSVGVESAPKVGSTFWFTLPLAEQNQ